MLHHFLPARATPPVRAEQIRLLYRQGAPIQLLGIATGLACVLLFWQVADHALLTLWLCVHVAVSLLRLAATVKFARSRVDEQHALERWGRGYVGGTFVSGLIWGSLSLFFDPAWPPAYQAVLFAVYTGITAGAFNTNSSLFVAFPAFYLPPVACLLYATSRFQGDGFPVLATLFVIYSLLMYVSALRFHNSLAQSLEARFENERLAAQLAESNEKLRYLAEMDELTGIPNRRAMDRSLRSEWNRHHRAARPLSLLFIDLDFFKQYNDTYGHDGGDHCLRRVARILGDHCQRSNDMPARFGGEEFAVILPETAQADASALAEKIRAEVERLQIPHSCSGVAGVVTLSIGVATLVPDLLDAHETLRRAADQALYQAKQAGRNRVVEATAPHDRRQHLPASLD